MGEGGGGSYSDPEIRGRPGLKKIFFRPFRRQFGLKIRGGRGGVALDPPLVSKLTKRKRKSLSLCSRPRQNVKLGTFTL